MQNNPVVELKFPLFNKIFCLALFLIMGCGVGGGFMLAPLFPQLMGAADDIANGSILTKIFVFFGGAGILLLFFYPVWAISFKVRADEQGLAVTKGWKTTFAPWQNVSSCQIEGVSKWYESPNYRELILRDSNGQILFRVPVRMLSALQNVEDFWQLLQQKVPES